MMLLAYVICSVALVAILGCIMHSEHHYMTPNRRANERVKKAFQQWADGPCRESEPRLSAEEPKAAARCEDAPPAEPAHAGQPAQGGDEPGPSPKAPDFPTPAPEANYYELLQVSPNADLDTIQRVFRFMAARFHPDNPDTGDNERFLQLKEAFEVLTDPVRRAGYDAANRMGAGSPQPAANPDSLDGMEGEANRRFAILALLYYRRRISPSSPGLSLAELQQRLPYSREFLEFTLWYLLKKSYIAFTDTCSDYALTETGVDYLERHSPARTARKLLMPGRSTNPGRLLKERASSANRIMRRPGGNPRWRRPIPGGSPEREAWGFLNRTGVGQGAD